MHPDSHTSISVGDYATAQPQPREMSDYEAAQMGVENLREMYAKLLEENVALRSQLRALHSQIKETQVKLMAMNKQTTQDPY